MDVEVIGVRKKYRNREVLSGASLEAARGECIGLLGPNGSGKSTLLSILAGVQKPDGGQFFWKKKELFADPGLRRSIVGYVPQNTPLVEELTAWDNLRFWYDKKSLRRELTDGVLAMLGIDEYLKMTVGKMSGGMKKRLSIGCAVAKSPQILLMDEPSTALDIPCRERIRTYLKAFLAGGGIVILATHDLQEMSLCHKWYLQRGGLLLPYRYDGDEARLAADLQE